MDRTSKNPPELPIPSSNAATAPEGEYVRLKLELAQTRAKTDSFRLRARELISKRDGLREAAAKSQADSEEQQLILLETRQSVKKLKAQLDFAEEERQMLWRKFEEEEGEDD